MSEPVVQITMPALDTLRLCDYLFHHDLLVIEEQYASVRRLPIDSRCVLSISKLEEQKVTDQTIGQHRVRLSFNPSANTLVDEIKRKSAELIDLCEKIKLANPHEAGRCAALAQTHYEDAAMWAVKAATT